MINYVKLFAYVAFVDYTVYSIPRSADWPVSFPLQLAVEYVLAMGLQPETIVLRL